VFRRQLGRQHHATAAGVPTAELEVVSQGGEISSAQLPGDSVQAAAVAVVRTVENGLYQVGGHAPRIRGVPCSLPVTWPHVYSAAVDTPTEIESKLDAYFSGRAVRLNWLLGKGVLLTPPYTVSVSNYADYHSIELTGRATDGTHVTVPFECTSVVIGRYRSEILLVDARIDPPAFRRLVPLQDARVKLLNIMPVGTSVSQQEYFALTPKEDGSYQSEAPRRWRELGWEFGLNVYEADGRYHRGSELEPIREPLPRPDMKRLTEAVLSPTAHREAETAKAHRG